ncbi:DNA helicase II [Zophobihabitans entericus]|uniref:DNA 3'-5' helicase n=1 Tax=Zophobihabitans entericus TaxID=1635327 RepID=A0A6G9IAN3_9GAMM|nr:DNA helicase II [Zophobihabitans entericus]QIQ21286.1 DNA helicase II [Zophobihabitans entericus]
MNHKLLESLNPEQQKAVTTDSQYTLVLAGAGSGKTRVLVHRIAWLCTVKNYSPNSIFAVTFTNKAAGEMQERIEELVGAEQFAGMWVGTFHGLTHRLLRIFSDAAKLPSNFQLIDTDDQHRLVKRIFREFQLDEKRWPTRDCAAYISTQKEKGLRPGDISPADQMEEIWKQVYTSYQAMCDRAGYVDFSELILRAYELLTNNAEVLSYCRKRFKNILVDEFQDTNHIQYQLVKRLAGDTANVMIVGDDDQSIYGWRGANSDNLQTFVNHYADTEIIRLEQNYRSTGAILQTANHLISHNQARLGKNLWTDQGNGEQISLYIGFNDLDEARYVIGQIKKYHQDGGNYRDCAILYRNNAQSRLFEDTLLQSAIPYHIYGSIRFYERQEVKLALAYLRLLYDTNNDVAFEQSVNTPARGVGDSTIDTIRNLAKQQNQSLWEVSERLIEMTVLRPKQRNGLSRFIELMNTMRKELAEKPFYEQIDRIIQDSGIYEMYEQESGIKGQSKLENLEELVSAAHQYYESAGDNLVDVHSGKTLTVLEAFLAYTSLEGKESSRNQDSVQLMTLHSAKGLEFEQVYIVGMEEGLFPAQRSIPDKDRMEEERRLAYVGITRARKHLTLSLAELRRLYGKEERNLPSRFLNELPPEWLNEVSFRGMTYSKPQVTQKEPVSFTFEDEESDYHYTQQDYKDKRSTKRNTTAGDDGYTLGRRVSHRRFGEGTIINLDGEGDHRRAQVAFVNEGIKWLVIKLANMTFL